MKRTIRRNSRSWNLALVLAVLAAFAFTLRAQQTATTVQSGTFTLTAANVSSLESLPDWQLKAVLQTLAATPLIWPDALPDSGMSGTYHSLAHPDWPPLPATFGSPVWKLTASSGSDFYLMDDLDYPPVPGDGGTNSDGGGFTNNFQPLVFTTNDLYLTINGATNDGIGWTANLTVHRPWDDTNLSHDLYYTTDLDAPIQWDFAMRCVYTNDVVPDLCSPIGFFRLGPATNGDLTVSTNETPQQLAEMLVPPWVTVTNATYTGADMARGTFAGGNGCGLPIDSGVIMASGYITNAIGPNNDDGRLVLGLGVPGDSDLDNLTGGGPTHDAAVLEFDIISTNSFTLQFQYVFASEEYPEYIGPYNDPMAIFVGTNFDGTNWVNSITNDIALVPGTTNVPVTVNTINGGCINDAYGGYDFPTNAQYYVDNHDPYSAPAVSPYAIPAPAFNIQYDGMTVLLTARATISANLTNHVKIAIADYNDSYWDSAVFLKVWSSCPSQ